MSPPCHPAYVPSVPTQSDFEHAARLARTTRDQLADVHRTLTSTRAERAVAGGTVGPLVDTGLGVATLGVEQLVHHLHDLATTCDRRAAVCAEHAEAIARWNHRTDQWEFAMARHREGLIDPTRAAPHPGPAPRRPSPPAPWVEPR